MPGTWLHCEAPWSKRGSWGHRGGSTEVSGQIQDFAVAGAWSASEGAEELWCLARAADSLSGSVKVSQVQLMISA